MARAFPDSSADGAFDDLVYRIHAGHDADDPWRGAIELLQDRLRARFVFLGRHRFVRGEDEVICAAPRASDFWEGYARFAGRNPWFLSSEDYVPGRVIAGYELLDPASLARTDFYRRLLQPHGISHTLCGVVGLHDDSAHYLMALRAESQGRFESHERSAMGRAVDHFRLALDSHWRLRQAEDLSRVLMRAVDHHAVPTFLVTSTNRLVHRNRKAELAETHSPALAIEDGELRGTTAANDKALRDAIHGVLRESATLGADACRVVNFSAADGRIATVMTVRAGGRLLRARDASAEDIVVITLRDAHSDHDPKSCAFARQYALTPAQSRVSSLVFCGHSLSSVARALDVSENTVRSHLKQVFEKTSTHGQLELVHLHARLCGNDG